MKTVILGGSGFIGQSLTRRLCDEGGDVTTVSRSPVPRLAPTHTHRDITLDDRRVLTGLLADADYVFHLASDTTPGSSRMQPGLELNNNLLPLAGLIECLQSLDKPSLVYVSSGGAIYDTGSDESLFSETSPTAPASYYGAGKLAAEAFIQAYHQQTGHSAIILRPANIYGPGQVPKKQFGIVPTLCQSLAEGRAFTVWGDGTAIRDYIFLSDFMDLCSSVVAAEWAPRTMELLNAGTGSGYSILELCEMLEAVSGKTLELDFQPPRGVDIPAVTLNSERARALLGWQAQVDLKKGLGETWQWFMRGRT